MLDYMFMPFKRYAQFTGRSRRMEFWAFALLNVIVTGLITAVVFATGGTYATFTGPNSVGYAAVAPMLFSGAGLLYVLWWAATIVPNIAVTVRRLHDRDMSGWWYLGLIVLSFVPLIGMIVGLAFLVLLLLPGTPGPNRFGPDPKDPTGSHIFA